MWERGSPEIALPRNCSIVIVAVDCGFEIYINFDATASNSCSEGLGDKTGDDSLTVYMGRGCEHR